jgi:hypothetical protein
VPGKFAGGFCGVNFERLGFCRKVGALLFDLARRNKAAGLETAAACNRCDAVRGAAHGGPSLALTGCACLAGANDVRSPVAVCRTTIQPDDRKLARSIMRIKTASLSKLSVAIRQARCPSMVIQRGKVRSVSAMGQLVNAIRRIETPRTGIIVMEHFAHQQNLAHCRRQLAEAELATSSDEIRHSMLMRLLAEEEAHGLMIADDGDPAQSAKDL